MTLEFDHHGLCELDGLISPTEALSTYGDQAAKASLESDVALDSPEARQVVPEPVSASQVPTAETNDADLYWKTVDPIGEAQERLCDFTALQHATQSVDEPKSAQAAAFQASQATVPGQSWAVAGYRNKAIALVGLVMLGAVIGVMVPDRTGHQEPVPAARAQEQKRIEVARTVQAPDTQKGEGAEVETDTLDGSEALDEAPVSIQAAPVAGKQVKEAFVSNPVPAAN